MADYLYADDGKIHTRYSELTRCTPGQVDRLLMEREGARSFENEDMVFGTDRHEIWAEESKASGHLPATFYRDGHTYHIEYVEREFTTEIMPNVVCHSRPDLVSKSAELIGDYKTIIADHYQEGYDLAWKAYGDFRQLKFYAFQLSLHGIRIKRLAYYVEVWNRSRTAVLGTLIIERKVRLADIAGQLPWVKDKIAMLVGAWRQRKSENLLTENLSNDRISHVTT